MNRRILYLVPSSGITLEQSGGAGTHIRGTIRGLRENGFEVLAIVGGDIMNGDGQNMAQTNTASVSKMSVRDILKRIMPSKIRLLLRDGRTVLQDLKFRKLTFNRIADFKPDFIYERSSYLSTCGLKISQELKIPHFIETDGRMVEIISKDYGVFSETIGNRIEKRKLEQSDYVVVLNRFSKELVANKFNLPKRKILIKTLGVSPSDFDINFYQIQALKKKYQLDSKFIVGFVGAVSNYHGVNYLIDAAKYVKGKSDEIIFMIVGWSQEAEKLKKLAEKYNLSNVIFVGKIDKKSVGNYYGLFDVGVIPDCEESIYPIKVLEYGLLELCPLVPAYEVFNDIIVPGETGYYFSPKNSQDLGDTILWLIKNKEKVGFCSKNWSDFVTKNFMWKDSVKEIIKVLNENTSFTSTN